MVVGPLLILAPPRSFTSVVCSMLGQHPQMYGLPEVLLFVAETMAQWWDKCSRAAMMDNGLVRAVAQMYFGEQTEYSTRLARGWLRRRSHLTTGMLLEALAERVRPSVLVEKSPGTTYAKEFLERAYRMFPEARFIHLLRHPRGYGESVVKYLREREAEGTLPRSHWVRYLAFPNQSASDGGHGMHDFDPQWSWYSLNLNVSTFLQSVPENQKRRIRGEDFLGAPDQNLYDVAAWMGLRTDGQAIEAMKHPERSPYACYGPPGARFGYDRHFLEDPSFHPDLAKSLSLEGPLSWRKDGKGFLPEVKHLAKQFGYE